MATYYYWSPLTDSTATQVVSVMSNATTNGTYISIYHKGYPTPATGQQWEVIEWNNSGLYFIRPRNCIAPPTSVLDYDNGIGNYTHLWEYYPNDNQLVNFEPHTLSDDVTYNAILRHMDGALLSYEGINNGDHLYSSPYTQSPGISSLWRWSLYTFVGGNPVVTHVHADYIKKNATRLTARIPRPIPESAALERLYAAVRKQRPAITGKPAPKLLTDAKPTPPVTPASKPKVEGNKVKRPTHKKAASKKPTSKKPSKAVKKPKKAASKKVKKLTPKKGSKPKAGTKSKSSPKPQSKAKAKKPAVSAKKAPKKAAGKKVKK